MRILIHSNAPWQPSGYGRQCALLASLLKELGHDVTISAISGLTGSIIEWNGIPVMPYGTAQFGVDTLIGHARLVQAELIITVMDFYQLWPIAAELRDFNVACWLPVDTEAAEWSNRTGLGRPYLETLKKSGARPIAMSGNGAKALANAGWPAPLFAPHMHDVDQAAYERHAADRIMDRALTGITRSDWFVIGICAANNDQFRKGFPEQLEAYRRFRALSPDYANSTLRVHTLAAGVGPGANLLHLAQQLDVVEHVEFSDHYAQVGGIFDQALMRDWFSQLDVLSNCAYGEGFGVTMLEAQAMGTPVIATRGSAMRDPYRANWLVEGEPFWNFWHDDWWIKPSIGGIVKAYVKAYKWASTKREKAREIAAPYHVDAQRAHWEQLLKELEPAS